MKLYNDHIVDREKIEFACRSHLYRDLLVRVAATKAMFRVIACKNNFVIDALEFPLLYISNPILFQATIESNL